MHELAISLSGVLLLFIIYLCKLDATLRDSHPEALKLGPKRWTEAEVKQTYEKLKTETPATRNLPAKKNRRYVVVGGGGLVGGWIVSQLLERGEDPMAIRILDLRAPVRKDLSKVAFTQVDITDEHSVASAFGLPWPSNVSSLPMTVFHTAALIGYSERAKDMMLPYYRVNVLGTENVLTASKKAGASCFVFTASGSTGMKVPTFFVPPWETWPRRFVQILHDALEPAHKDHHDFLMAYCVAKAEAEKIVLAANNEKGEFLTGAIRPGHAIIGHGTNNPSSLTVDCLQRKGGLSFTHKVISSFVSAENVALAHIRYEDALLDPSADRSVQGRAFYITDPNPPIAYTDFYNGLAWLAETAYHTVPLRPIPMLVISYLVETYEVLRFRYLNFLPAASGDIRLLQPALFNVGYVNVIVTNEQAEKTPAEGGIGFEGTVTTMEAVCKSALEWNQQHAASSS